MENYQAILPHNYTPGVGTWPMAHGYPYLSPYMFNMFNTPMDPYEPAYQQPYCEPPPQASSLDTVIPVSFHQSFWNPHKRGPPDDSLEPPSERFRRNEPKRLDTDNSGTTGPASKVILRLQPTGLPVISDSFKWKGTLSYAGPLGVVIQPALEIYGSLSGLFRLHDDGVWTACHANPMKAACTLTVSPWYPERRLLFTDNWGRITPISALGMSLSARSNEAVGTEGPGLASRHDRVFFKGHGQNQENVGIAALRMPDGSGRLARSKYESFNRIRFHRSTRAPTPTRPEECFCVDVVLYAKLHNPNTGQLVVGGQSHGEWTAIGSIEFWRLRVHPTTRWKPFPQGHEKSSVPRSVYVDGLAEGVDVREWGVEIRSTESPAGIQDTRME